MGAAMPRGESAPSIIMVIRGCCAGVTGLNKFHHLDGPFAAFVFSDERLWPTKAFGEFELG
jgi:hypothetical protein